MKTLAELEKIQTEITALAGAVIDGTVSKEAALQKVDGLTILLTQKNKSRISELFEYIIVPSELFEKAMNELKERKKKYTAIEARGCILSVFGDNPNMTEENRKTFVAAVLKNVLPDEMERF